MKNFLRNPGKVALVLAGLITLPFTYAALAHLVLVSPLKIVTPIILIPFLVFFFYFVDAGKTIFLSYIFLALLVLVLVLASMLYTKRLKVFYYFPFYWYHGALAGMSYFKHHVSFGFSYALPIEIRQTLETQGYHTGSKTVQIKFDQPVPVSEIQQILKTQARLNETKKTEKVM